MYVLPGPQWSTGTRVPTVKPFTGKLGGINVCVLVQATYSQELKFAVQL